MADQGSESLAKWIVSGLAAGVAVLGIAIGAYAIGYHRGEHHRRSAAPAPPAAATTTQTTTAAAAPSTTTGAPAAVEPTPALVARGKQLYTADGCSACHSLSGAAGAGPGFGGLAGSSVALDDGRSVTADAAYLSRSITDPDADVVKGYHAGIMGPAISGFGLGQKPDDVRALVAFVESRK